MFHLAAWLQISKRRKQWDQSVTEQLTDIWATLGTVWKVPVPVGGSQKQIMVIIGTFC